MGKRKAGWKAAPKEAKWVAKREGKKAVLTAGCLAVLMAHQSAETTEGYLVALSVSPKVVQMAFASAVMMENPRVVSMVVD